MTVFRFLLPSVQLAAIDTLGSTPLFAALCTDNRCALNRHQAGVLSRFQSAGAAIGRDIPQIEQKKG